MKEYEILSTDDIMVKVSKESLAFGLYSALEELLLEIHGDKMEEDIRDYNLYTCHANDTVYMREYGSKHSQDIAIDARAVALVDAINVLLEGKTMEHKEKWVF